MARRLNGQLFIFKAPNNMKAQLSIHLIIFVTVPDENETSGELKTLVL